ncbi:hypothetical protein BASA81_002196 [Batrachochytrium salamandrivorans]|nr:hypothetical protein BASA81_002196 [Batrachochytrium salamandrivorans]
MLRQVLCKRSYSIKTVGVCGVGLLGHGIAQTAAENGYKVVLYDSNEQALERGYQMIQKSLTKVAEKQAAKKLIPSAPEFVSSVMGRISKSPSLELKEFAKTQELDLVIEAIVENVDIKRSFYSTLGQFAPQRTILASNTSSLSIQTLAEASGRPKQVVGLHFFNPVQLMQLVEVISLKDTDSKVTEAVTEYIKTCKKTPVPCADTPGFIVNRLLVPYLMEAMALVERGDATIEAVDAAMKLGAGHPMGPIYLADYIGLDTCLSIIKGWQQNDKTGRFFVPKNLERLVAEGKLGRKSGEGFYGKAVWGGK